MPLKKKEVQLIAENNHPKKMIIKIIEVHDALFPQGYDIKMKLKREC